MFGLRNMCLCVLRIIIRRSQQTEENSGNQEPSGSQKPTGNVSTENLSENSSEDLSVTKLTRQYAICNYPDLNNKI